MGVLCAAPLLQAQAQADVSLVKNAQPQASIVLPEKSGPATKLAAQELQTYFEKISGAKLPVVSTPPQNGGAILLQNVGFAPGTTLTAKLADNGDNYTLQATGSTLAVRGNSDVAVLYGAYQILENIGVRWLMPGELGENVPQKKEIVVPDGTREYIPSFRSRVIDLSGRNEHYFDARNMAQQHRDYDLWLLRNKMQFVRSVHDIAKNEAERAKYPHEFDFNWTRENSQHNLTPAALKGADFSLEPERFALVTRDGVQKRREPPKERVQACLTHPKNIATAVQSALDHFAARPDQVNFPISLDDTGGLCECDNCKRANDGLDPNKDPNRVVWNFWRAVASELLTKAPGKRIAFYATYSLMTRPPFDVQALPNMVAVTCHVNNNSRDITAPNDPHNRAYLDHIRLVKAAGPQMGAYDYTSYAGHVQPLAVLNSVKTYHALGYVWYHCESMGRDEQRNIVAWAQAQMAWNAEQDPQALLETFCREYYGAAGGDVLATLQLIDDQIRKLPRIIWGDFGTSQLIFSPETVQQGRALLQRASTQVAGNTKEVERLRRFNDTFEMLSRAAGVARAYYTALDERSEASKQKALDEVAAFSAFWKERDLGQTCAPNALANVNKFADMTKAIKAEVTPVASPTLTGADRSTLVRELFNSARVPERMSDLYLLPERWKFHLDVNDQGIKEGWMRPNFDASKWTEISIYNFYERQGFDGYDGIAWYRTEFTAPVFPKGKQVWLRIGALDDDGTIYVNKRPLERYGFDPLADKESFAFDITHLIRPGESNIIAVRGRDVYGAGGLWKPCALYAL